MEGECSALGNNYCSNVFLYSEAFTFVFVNWFKCILKLKEIVYFCGRKEYVYCTFKKQRGNGSGGRAGESRETSERKCGESFGFELHAS